jgi:sugar lactone lactonase YvrE
MKAFWLAFGFCIFGFVSVSFAFGGEVLSELPSPVVEPMGMTAMGDFLWISDMSSRTYNKVRRSDGEIEQKIEAPGFMPTGVAWTDGMLFTADRRLDWIARRSVTEDKDLSPIPYYERWATGMTHDGVHLWVVDARAAKVHQVDPVDGTTIKSFAAPAKDPTGIAFDGRFLWVADHVTDEIYMMDRETGRVISMIPAPGPYPNALAFADQSLWVADYQTRRLYRVEMPGTTPYVEDKERKAHVSFDVLYRAEGSGVIMDLTAYVALPKEIPGQHILSEIQFKPQPTRIVHDKWDQRIAVFELGALKTGQLKQIRWEADFALYQTRFQLDPDRIENAGPPTDMDEYLKDDKKYDLSSHVIGELVDTLTKETTTYYGRARAIYDHLTEVITYERSGGWNNAAAVLERGTGSCSEYTFALVALLRRAGIPARYVGALSERGDEGSFDDVFHRWAEVYLPGYGWVPVDANAGFGKLPGEQGGYFGGRSNRHVITTIGGGASEYLDWDYNSHDTFKTQDNATLEVRAIARYRPLEGEVTVSEP